MCRERGTHKFRLDEDTKLASYHHITVALGFNFTTIQSDPRRVTQIVIHRYAGKFLAHVCFKNPRLLFIAPNKYSIIEISAITTWPLSFKIIKQQSVSIPGLDWLEKYWHINVQDMLIDQIVTCSVLKYKKESPKLKGISNLSANKRQ